MKTAFFVMLLGDWDLILLIGKAKETKARELES